MNGVKMLFPQWKKKCFTMSYDDGVIQDKRLVAIMNEYGIKGTFNLNSTFLGRQESAVIDGYHTDISTIPKDKINELYAGHEIACHGLTHMKLTDRNSVSVINEIVDDRKQLEYITNKIISGFAYPFGLYDENVINLLRICGIKYARTVDRTGSFEIPDNFMKWNPTCHHNDSDLMNLLEVFCNENSFLDQAGLFYLWGHAYEFDQKESWDVIEEACSYVNKYKDNIWMATNGEIAEYIDKFKRLEYSADGSMIYNPSDKDVFLESNGEKLIINSGKVIIHGAER